MNENQGEECSEWKKAGACVGDFMLRDNIVTRMFKLGLDFMKQ